MQGSNIYKTWGTPPSIRRGVTLTASNTLHTQFTRYFSYQISKHAYFYGTCQHPRSGLYVSLCGAAVFS